LNLGHNVQLLTVCKDIFNFFAALHIEKDIRAQHFFLKMEDFLAYFMCTVQTDFDVTMGRLQNQGYIQRVDCNTANYRFYIIIVQQTL